MIFLILVFLHIPLLYLNFHLGINPMREYLVKEMLKNNYISKSDAKILLNNNDKTKNKIYNEKINQDNRGINNDDNIIRNKNRIYSNRNKNIHTMNSSSLNRIKISKTEFLAEKNNKGKKTKGKKSKKKKKIKYKKNLNFNNDNIKTKNNAIIPTQGIISNEDDEFENEPQNNFIDLSLIHINLKTGKSFKETASNHVLIIYTSFEEATKRDIRCLWTIFYIFLLSKQAVFHAFLYKSPLELFPIRFCLLIFIVSSDLALNSIFYFEEKISEKYNEGKNSFLFAFTNNFPIILLSTFIGFVLIRFFTKLSNSTNEIRNVFRNEEKKIKKNKNYVVSEQRKKVIQIEIEKILKKYKIKVVIFVIIELFFMLFYWYYITAFCHVYSSTQLSWLWDSFISMIIRLIIDLLFSIIFAKLYRIGVGSESYCIYKASLLFYSFG